MRNRWYVFGALAFAAALSGATTKSSPVADAAMKGDVAAVRRLIAQGADVNAAQGDGMTALHWAAEHGDSALAVTLLHAHASVKASTRVGSYTPLHIAAKAGSGAIVRALLKAGADANAVTTSGATALHFAAEAGSADAATALLDHHADPNARESEWGQTPLVFAAAADRAEVIRVLLKRGADPSIRTRVVSLTEQQQQDALAAKKRNEILLSMRPEEKARLDSIAAARQAAAQKLAAEGPLGGGGAAPPDQGGRGPAGPPQPKIPYSPAEIQRAIEESRKALAERPTGNVRVEEDTTDGQVANFAGSVGSVGGLTALHHAVRQGNLSAVLALLDGGADINERSGSDSTTPLLMATINGQFDVAMKLIERGANPNIPSIHNATPLYTTINTQWAPRSRFPQPEVIQNQQTTYLEVMEALLKAKADPNVRIKQHLWYFAYNNCGNANCGLENLEGTTAFWRAAYAVDVDAMKLLVKYGADPKIPSQRNPDAVASGRRGGRGGRGGGGALLVTDTTKMTRAQIDSARQAVAAQFQGRFGGGGGRGGAPFRPTDPALDSAMKAATAGVGVYPVHAAAGVGYGNGFAGNSHRHAPDGWLPAMKYLVEVLGADVNARDPSGYTPLHHAAARGDNEMIMYLVSKGADVKAVSRNGFTVLDMANGPVQRVRPLPETIALLEKLGAKNQHRCVSC